MERSAGETEQREERDDGEGGDGRRRFPWEEEPEGDDEPGIVKRNLDELGEEAAEDARRLHGGGAVGILGARVPVRMIGAISVFVGVFVLVYLLTWAALGDIGLAVGFILAAIVAVIAVKLFASLSSSSTPGAG
jgi:hypothetical protein